MKCANVSEKVCALGKVKRQCVPLKCGGDMFLEETVICHLTCYYNGLPDIEPQYGYIRMHVLEDFEEYSSMLLYFEFSIALRYVW